MKKMHAHTHTHVYTHFNFYIVKQERKSKLGKGMQKLQKEKHGILWKKRMKNNFFPLFLFARIIKGWWEKM